jgi:hypothetical protein
VRHDGGGAAVGGDDRDVGRSRVARQVGDGLGAVPGVVGVPRIGPDAGDADESFEVGAGTREDSSHGGGDGLLRHVPGY